LKQKKLDCCVISIGNITVGGTGKTPTAQKVAVIIKNMGYRVVILNRGYRSHWDQEMGLSVMVRRFLRLPMRPVMKLI